MCKGIEVSTAFVRQRCGLSLNLHPYSVNASSKVSGVVVRTRRLAEHFVSTLLFLYSRTMVIRHTGLCLNKAFKDVLTQRQAYESCYDHCGAAEA